MPEETGKAATRAPGPLPDRRFVNRSAVQSRVTVSGTGHTVPADSVSTMADAWPPLPAINWPTRTGQMSGRNVPNPSMKFQLGGHLGLT